MVVLPRLSDKNRPARRGGFLAGRDDEQGIAAGRRVIDNPFAIGRKVQLRNRLLHLQKRLKRPAQGRHGRPGIDQTTALVGVRPAAPQHDLRAVRYESDRPGRGVAQFRQSAIRQVVVVAVGSRADLADPGVPDTACLPIGNEHDELSVARDGRVLFGAFEIRQRRKRRPLERVPPEELGPFRQYHIVEAAPPIRIAAAAAHQRTGLTRDRRNRRNSGRSQVGSE